MLRWPLVAYPLHSSCAMKQADCKKGPFKKTLANKKKLLRFSIACESPARIQLSLPKKARAVRVELLRSARSSALLRFSSFNLNSLTEEECFPNFRFRRAEIGGIAPLLEGPTALAQQATDRSRRSLNSAEAICIILRGIASPCRWLDAESMFGKPSPAQSEIF